MHLEGVVEWDSGCSEEQHSVSPPKSPCILLQDYIQIQLCVHLALYQLPPFLAVAMNFFQQAHFSVFLSPVFAFLFHFSFFVSCSSSGAFFP